MLAPHSRQALSCVRCLVLLPKETHSLARNPSQWVGVTRYGNRRTRAFAGGPANTARVSISSRDSAGVGSCSALWQVFVIRDGRFPSREVTPGCLKGAACLVWPWKYLNTHVKLLALPPPERASPSLRSFVPSGKQNRLFPNTYFPFSRPTVKAARHSRPVRSCPQGFKSLQEPAGGFMEAQCDGLLR